MAPMVLWWDVSGDNAHPLSGVSSALLGVSKLIDHEATST